MGVEENASWDKGHRYMGGWARGEVKIDDPDITMEDYIQLDVEKARRHDHAFNWKTATYGKVRYFGDID
nr:hypothetical protein [Tanacetum cinerariifolium]